MNNIRLDQALVQKGLAPTRSQAESYIKLGYAKINGKAVNKPGFLVSPGAKITLTIKEQYVSRAALKLASVASKLNLGFKDKTVLDVGSSTGGFTDYALRNGAKKVIAVDVGAGQMHPTLRSDKRIELHEKTDIRNVEKLSAKPDIVLIDVSFISLREVLPFVTRLIGKNVQIVSMVKPQFEAGAADAHKGIIKNDSMRRRILRDFEAWTKKSFVIQAKADSEVAGAKGNLERFYLLQSLEERT
jgi:23S rRNA (cytidine1920-2'-O)/16S rRNA (cytidine1409-2'-O)-methyltransferase